MRYRVEKDERGVPIVVCERGRVCEMIAGFGPTRQTDADRIAAALNAAEAAAACSLCRTPYTADEIACSPDATLCRPCDANAAEAVAATPSTDEPAPEFQQPYGRGQFYVGGRLAWVVQRWVPMDGSAPALTPEQTGDLAGRIGRLLAADAKVRRALATAELVVGSGPCSRPEIHGRCCVRCDVAAALAALDGRA